MRIDKINSTVLSQEIKDQISSKVDEVTLSNTKTDIQNMIDEINANIGSVRKPPVDTFEDLATTYPNPQQGWLVKVENPSGLHYQYDEVVQGWYVVTMNPVPVASDTTDGLLKKEDKEKLDSIEPNAQINLTSQEILDELKIIDGHGSGLDSDTVDGKHADEFALVNHNHDTEYPSKQEMSALLNTKANVLALNKHTNNEDVHITNQERSNWNAGIIKVSETRPDKSGEFLFWLDINSN